MTTKLTEFSKTPADQIIPRILASVHASLDKNFPETQSVRPQFAKTVFAGGGESTAANPAQNDQNSDSIDDLNVQPRMFPDDAVGQFSKDQKTIFVRLKQRTLLDYFLFVLFVSGVATLVYLIS